MFGCLVIFSEAFIRSHLLSIRMHGVQEKVEEEAEPGPEAAEVEAMAGAADKAELLSLHISEWMLSMLAMPSTPLSPPWP